MEFRQLEAFVNAVKYKSFSKAADATFLTQPTISAHINNLENEMGTTLVNRTGREITLTKQGELFYPYAIDMLIPGPRLWLRYRPSARRWTVFWIYMHPAFRGSTICPGS